MRPEILVAARLRGEAWPIMVKWKDQTGRWETKLCWTLKGTTHALYLPRHITWMIVNFAGQDFPIRDKYSWESQTWIQILPIGPWFPEVPGNRGAADIDGNTWLWVRNGKSNKVIYRRVKHYERK